MPFSLLGFCLWINFTFKSILALVPTQGSYFVFIVFFVLFLENKYALAQGVARDKLVFGMLKLGDVSFQTHF